MWFYEACDTHPYDGQVDGRYDEGLALDESPLEVDYISQKLYEEGRKEANLGKHEDGIKSENSMEDCSHKPHHLTGRFKVSEETMKHFEDTHILVSEYCWRAMVE